MAAVDKVYGTVEQWDELHKWLEKNRPDFLHSMNLRGADYIALFSIPEDVWLYQHCPIQWLKDRIYEQYDGDVSVPEDYY